MHSIWQHLALRSPCVWPLTLESEMSCRAFSASLKTEGHPAGKRQELYLLHLQKEQRPKLKCKNPQKLVRWRFKSALSILTDFHDFTARWCLETPIFLRKQLLKYFLGSEKSWISFLKAAAQFKIFFFSIIPPRTICPFDFFFGVIFCLLALLLNVLSAPLLKRSQTSTTTFVLL